MKAAQELGELLHVDPLVLKRLDGEMGAITSRRGVLEKVAEENSRNIARVMKRVGFSPENLASEVKSTLRLKLSDQEKELSVYLHSESGFTEFDKAITLARRMRQTSKGFFLKPEFAREILLQAKPENLLAFRGYRTMEELLKREDLFSAFSALRFTESNEWMHETFARFYSRFTPADFEERNIEIRVLGPEWKPIAEKFVAKKHHNVSHLKEFGVIFLNPIREGIRGALLRDFALLLHYSHEVEFYARLFKKYASAEDFAERLKSLLRGDILERFSVAPGEWLIVQRYLAKENPGDKRIFLPRVNPESMHWIRAERDLTDFFRNEGAIDLDLWEDCDWVGAMFSDKEHGGDLGKSLVSFDIEDNTMSLVSFHEGKHESFTYHHNEALWTKLFKEYAGGEDEMERLLVENFDKGIIRFSA